MKIKIISKRKGFRRCGIAHDDKPVLYPHAHFTEEEIRRLKAEPLLIVEEVADEEDKAEEKERGGVFPQGSSKPQEEPQKEEPSDREDKVDKETGVLPQGPDKTKPAPVKAPNFDGLKRPNSNLKPTGRKA